MSWNEWLEERTSRCPLRNLGKERAAGELRLRRPEGGATADGVMSANCAATVGLVWVAARGLKGSSVFQDFKSGAVGNWASRPG